MKSVLKKNINLIDLGSGGGHFLKALETEKIKGVGFETNEILINLAKKKLKKIKFLNLKSINLKIQLTTNNLMFYL